MKNVTELIKQKRKLLGWSLKDTAQKFDLTTTGYAKIENGETSITLERLYQIAEIFGVSVGELLGLEASGVPNGGEAKEVEELKKEVERLNTQSKLMEKLLMANEQNFQRIKYEVEHFILELIDNVGFGVQSFIEDILRANDTLGTNLEEIVYKLRLFEVKNEDSVFFNICVAYAEYFKKKVWGVESQRLKMMLNALENHNPKNWLLSENKFSLEEFTESLKFKIRVLEEVIRKTENKENHQNKRNL